MNSRVKILLDADVVIDFIDGHQFSILPRILPSYDFVILDLVMNQKLGKHPTTTHAEARKLRKQNSPLGSVAQRVIFQKSKTA